MNYTTDYTSLKENSNEAGRYGIIESGSYLPLPFGTRIEVDLKAVDGVATNNPFRVMAANATSSLSSPTITQLGLTVGEFTHVIMDVTSENLVITREDGTTATRQLPANTQSAVAMAFWTHGDITELQFKNLKIYPI